MEQIVVKTEVQSNGEILLYYVDENGDSQEGVLTTIENIENDAVQIQDNYILGSYGDLVEDAQLEAPEEDLQDPWSDDDVKRLLIFYNDNKSSFISGATQKRHLWAVACKTMLIGKNQQSCEEKLAEIKAKYFEVNGYIKKGIIVKWPFLELCHQAFHDDVAEATETTVVEQLPQSPQQQYAQPNISILKQETIKEKDGILSIKQVNTKAPDEKVVKLLNLYLKYKESFQREHWRRDLWEKIASEMGEDDSEYLQKRFLNHKHHYVTMLSKKKELGSASITWPYMELFDKIFGDDASFHKKYFNVEPEAVVDHTIPEHEWSITQTTVLAKYYFDCYEEFEDRTIPDKFLWTEVGRLIDKKPESCQIKYEVLRREHLEQYLAGDYNIQTRKPMAIIFDNIIVKDVKTELSNSVNRDIYDDMWKSAEVDELVQFFYDNIEVFKDPVCHFVCWAAIAHKLKRSVDNCKKQWDDLVSLYNTILEDKKENPDMQIDWRYIELFDRILDYGMDSNLLKGYDISKSQVSSTVGKVVVKKINIGTEKESRDNRDEISKVKDDPDYLTTNMEPRTDPRSTKILEHYLKNKDKYQYVRNKLSLWDPLAKQINMTSTQCAHRFRTLKQTYIDYIQREIDQPRLSITWPYYALCKKVFGYRIIKNKLKHGQMDTDSDWLAREIKLLISFFSKNFHDITDNIEDVSKWAPLAKELGKSELNCKEKFVELRKCYRKLKTMRRRNPDVNISWSYFNTFDRIYSSRDTEQTDPENMDVEHLEMEGVESADAEGGEDDYQCIIVLQEGQEIPDISNAQIIIQENPGAMDSNELIQQISDMPQLDENLYIPPPKLWTKRTKKRLLIFYINYIRLHRGKEINPKEMWATIAAKLPNKSPIVCRKMLAKMKNSYKQADDVVKKNSPFSYLLEKVLKLKPKFVKLDEKKQEERTYKDMPMDSEKVNLALGYYLEHIEEFVNPRFEKKYLWTQLANYIQEPVTKVYNKINYLKQAYNIETEEIAGEKTEFSGLLKEIIAKEVAVKIILDINPNPDFTDQENSWTDEETMQLLHWYLSNLDKFKNPKFNRSYLWMEASSILSKSPLVCSKKMSEIRTQYRNMVKENAESLSEWRFFDLCQKIYGTGKKSNNMIVDN